MSVSARHTHIVPHDSTIVGIHDPAEVLYWAGRFAGTPEDVIQAVGLVGPKFRDVQIHLEQLLARRERFTGAR